MLDSPLDWIWSEYTTSPDPASGMQSLYQTCSWLTKHILLPSHIVLSGGGYVLHPEIAQIFTNVVPEIELQILTNTTGLLVPATQNQVVWNWIMLMDKLYDAMIRLKSLRMGDPISGSTSRMPQILAALPPSLRIKLPTAFLESHGMMVLPPAANTSQVLRRKADARKRLQQHSCVPTRGLRMPPSEAEDGALVTEAPYKSNVLEWRVSGSTTGIGLVHAPITPCPPHPIATARASDAPKAMHAGSLHYAGPNISTPDFSSQFYDLVWQRATYITTMKSLDSRDIVDRGANSDLDRRPVGRFGLETGFLRTVNNTVNDMQSILATVSSHFLVDPYKWRGRRSTKEWISRRDTSRNSAAASRNVPLVHVAVSATAVECGGQEDSLKQVKSATYPQGNVSLTARIVDERASTAIRSAKLRTLESSGVPGIRSRSRLREHAAKAVEVTSASPVRTQTFIESGTPSVHSSTRHQRVLELDEGACTLERAANTAGAPAPAATSSPPSCVPVHAVVRASGIGERSASVLGIRVVRSSSLIPAFVSDMTAVPPRERLALGSQDQPPARTHAMRGRTSGKRDGEPLFTLIVPRVAYHKGHTSSSAPRAPEQSSSIVDQQRGGTLALGAHTVAKYPASSITVNTRAVEDGGRHHGPTSTSAHDAHFAAIIGPCAMELRSLAPGFIADDATVELEGLKRTPKLELDGRTSNDHMRDSILEADTLTLPTLDDASSCGVPEITCMTPASLLPSLSILLSVLSVTPLIKTSALVSAVEWTYKISYLGLLVVSSSEPNLVWAQEGIGTFTWN
ncbi:hypothetical protein B0H14DRAFT_3519774 [Mycena olivaceomarginata]|nr:hypothetical protein B0H14DRAFT_3519774 [Mycena olivaceomarginata]